MKKDDIFFLISVFLTAVVFIMMVALPLITTLFVCPDRMIYVYLGVMILIAITDYVLVFICSKDNWYL